MNYPMVSKDSRVNRTIIIAIFLALAIVYSLFNPEEYQIFPQCPFRQLTGLLCPGCGSQRAIHQLLNGHLFSAIQYNAFLVVTLPWISAIILFKYFAKNKGEQIIRILLKRSVVNTYLIVLIIWWVYRNVAH
ncbi:DUF2752 domain-containing protein [Bacteroides cellulosilyticus]|uniref:DUF2752 domain-containing protein n=2 Tax=Bacteroides TaxID=816 RepID=UPI0032EB18D8